VWLSRQRFAASRLEGASTVSTGQTTEIRVPDIGDFTDVPVIEIHVSPGDEVSPEDPLVTLESDKATMDVPAPQAGTVKQLQVKIGDRVSEGSVLLTLEGDGATPLQAAPEQTAGTPEQPAGAPGQPPAAPQPPAVTREPPAPRPESEPGGQHDTQVVVIGSGPGGYTAAFRAADLGLRTILIERYPRLGGVCLNVGCIPSKALLHAARVVAEAEEMANHGLRFGQPEVDLDALRSWKDAVVGKLTGGLGTLANQRNVEVIQGLARLTGPNTLVAGERTVSFERCIIATGSEAASLPGLPEDERIIDSTAALDIADIPGRLLVIGGGIIGLEMATVYAALGSAVTVVELLDQLVPGCDPDLVRPLHRRIAQRYEAIRLATKVEKVQALKNGLAVTLSNGDVSTFDRILVAVGRIPLGRTLDAEAAGVSVDGRGFIPVDQQLRTNVAHIHAIGDVADAPLLAHKAAHQGKVAAEVIAGREVAFDARAIPSVAYTDPEIAWMGLTESRAREEGLEYEKAIFPWSASGRALTLDRDEGLTKLLFEPGTRRLLGAGITGVGAGELIAETVHALEMGSNAEDIGLTIHPHPTLSETVMFAGEMAEGTITDLMPPRRTRTG
jgi:dihydrolipoamide dehydrogenase